MHLFLLSRLVHPALELPDTRDGLNELEISVETFVYSFCLDQYFLVSLTSPCVYHQKAFEKQRQRFFFFISIDCELRLRIGQFQS